MAFQYVSALASPLAATSASDTDRATDSSLLVELARQEFAEAHPTEAGDGDGATKPVKKVSPRAFWYLGLAQDAINYTKKVITDQGNQIAAIARSKGNSFNRLKVMRQESYWSFTSVNARSLAAADPAAYTAAKADFVHGGNCGEHAAVAFNYLTALSSGIALNRVSYTGLDHAFVIMGDLAQPKLFPDNELVVSDPWPNTPEACLWEDHFANGGDRSQIQVAQARTSNSTNNAAQIKAGLVLSEAGARLASSPLPESQQAEMLEHPDTWHLWQHDDASSPEYEYEIGVNKKVELVMVEVPRGKGWDFVARELKAQGIVMSVNRLMELNEDLVLHPGRNVVMAER